MCCEIHFTLHDFLLVAEPGLVLLLSCEELELISSSSSSSSSKFILLDMPSKKKKTEKSKSHRFFLLLSTKYATLQEMWTEQIPALSTIIGYYSNIITKPL